MKHMFDCAMLGKERKIQKSDWIFGAVVLVLAIMSYFFFRFFYGEEGGYVQVMLDGRLHAEYSLDSDITVSINGAQGQGCNVLVIEDGQAYVKEADCPDRLCVKQKRISKTGESIVCLPHKLVITVVGGEESEYDGFTG